MPGSDSAQVDHVAAAVVGTGFAGLGAAIGLKRAGRDDFIVLERAGGVGGTWRDNSYPGCMCDVPSNLYSFSFAPNPNWSRSFSHQPEIRQYLQRTARDCGVLPHMRFDTELLGARWDETALRWSIRTSRGELTADVLIAGSGELSEPSIPAIPGLDTFSGATFHSASWRHDVDLTGKRVAVIGTGASAIQFVPHVQRVAAHMTLFQRSAPWVLPRWDRDVSSVEHRLFRRFPALQQAVRAAIYWGRESWILGFSMRFGITRQVERLAILHLRRQIHDPELQAKVMPHFRLGCKRVLLSSDYYPALDQPNVDVVTDRIDQIVPEGVVAISDDGTRATIPVDAIIFGTGFRPTDQPIAYRLLGRGGRTLADYWAENSMSALYGLTVEGFPNLFLLAGPNTGSGHTSVVFMIEAQLRYMLDTLRQMDAHDLAAIEPRLETQTAFNDRVQQQFERTVWHVGRCSSWYLDKRGRNTTLWPTFSYRFRQQLRHCNLSDYVVYRRSEQSEAVSRAREMSR